MQRTLIADLVSHKGEEVLVKGWIQDIRNLSKIKFVIIRDRTGDMQCIALKNSVSPELFETVGKLVKESVIELTAKVNESKESHWGIELEIKDLKVLNESEPELPIDNTDKSTTEFEKKLDYRFLDTRNRKVGAVFRVRSKIVRILTDFFDEEGFTIINTAKLTCIGVESGSALFEVKYFDRPAYLAQSPQIYKQMFVAGGFERVAEFGVVFRAENSNTTRHLTEFTGVDFEMGFIDDYTEVMDMIEKMFGYLLTKLKVEAAKELELLGVTIDIPQKIPRISMAEAKELLKAKGKSYPAEEDLDPEGERMFGEIVKEKYGSDMAFLTLFPIEKRPFYHMRPDGDPKVTKSFDLIYKGVEVATGAQREHRFDVLKAQTEEKGMNLEEMPEYSMIFKFGIPPHGGVGFGLDRITQRILGIPNIREAVLLPRDPKRLKP